MTKSETVRRAVAAGDYKTALKIAKGFQINVTKEQRDAMTRAYECMLYPEFYGQLLNCQTAIDEGIETVVKLFGEKPDTADEKAAKYEVFFLEVYLEEDGWVENERHSLGELEIVPAMGREVDGSDILTAMKKFSYEDFSGLPKRALITTDQRTVYAEAPYGDDEWWVVGAVKGHVPVYGLRRQYEVA